MTVAVRPRVRPVLLALGLLAVPFDLADAAGFEIYNQGARAMGFAGAYVAQAYDPSAIYFNAGGVGLLKGKHIYLSAGFGDLTTDFTGEGPFPPAGTLERSDSGLGILPSVYYTHQVAERWVLGVGFYNQFGFVSKWDDPDAFTGRYICTDCRIRARNLNPTVAYKLADRLAIGAGVDLLFAKFDHQQRLLAEPNPFPDPTDVAELTIDGASATSFGWNVGLLAAPSESFSIGIHFRSRVAAEYEGTADFNQILTGNDVVDTIVAASLPPRQPVRVSHYYPATLSGGIAVRGQNWTVEGDIIFSFWSSFDTVMFSYPQGDGVGTTQLVQDYEDIWEGRLGVEYLLSETWAVRAGYAYDHSPQPTPTLSPFLHDEDRHVFGVGGTYRYENMELDLFGRYLLFRDRNTRGLSEYDYEGLYQSNSFQVGAALGYRF
ncbi:MAG: outer membrane protein transport protein [Acidobacteriota bacterium]|jgi:long-chain fatty acid transport protein